MKHIFTLSKKILLVIPLVLIFFHMLYADGDGPGVWTQDLTTTNGVWQKCIAINPTNQQIMYAGTNGQGVYKTTNGGGTWAQSNTGLTNLGIFSLEISNSNPSILYAGTIQSGSSPGVYKTTDAGATWTFMSTGITESSIAIASMAIDPTNPNIVYITIFDGLVNASVGIFKTTNGGTSWAPANTGIGTIKNFLSLVINPLNPNVLYVGSSIDVVASMGPVHIYKSVNGAASWTDVSSGLPAPATDNDPVRTMSMSTVDTSRVLAGLFQNTIAGGAFLTTNGGLTWVRMSTGIPNVAAVQIRSILIRPGSNTEFYAGLDVSAATGQIGGVYRSTNGGISWTAFNGGTVTTTSTVRALNFRTSTDSTIFAGISLGPIGMHEYTWIPVGIHNPVTGIPNEFALNQNYPNPFNPVTLISFDIPKESFVTLKVYDVSGKVVRTLVNENRTAGTYSVNFDANGLSSGVYFYKLTSSDFTATRKMILTK